MNHDGHEIINLDDGQAKCITCALAEYSLGIIIKDNTKHMRLITDAFNTDSLKEIASALRLYADFLDKLDREGGDEIL